MVDKNTVKQSRINSIFRTGVLNFLFQFIFLAIMFFIGREIALNITSSFRFLALAGFVLVPAIIWSVFFYIQDRLQPEPIPHLIVSFISGMSAVVLVALPFQEIIFRISEWMYSSALYFALGSFFIKAFIFCFLMYIIIRYGFYPQKEFDEPVDGMVYGAIAGTGFAFVASIYYLWINPSYTLFVIAYNATANVLIYSGVGSIIGYFIARAKFKRKNIDRCSLYAMVTGTIILGIYYIFNEFIFISGFSHSFWFSFVLTLAFALLILVFCYLQMKKLTKKDYQEKIAVSRSFDIFSYLFIIIFFTFAITLSVRGQKGERFYSEKYGISFHYPYSVSQLTLTNISNPLSILEEDSELIFSGANEATPNFFINVKVYKNKSINKNKELLNLIDSSNTKSLTMEKITINKKSGHRIIYSYLNNEINSDKKFPELIMVYKDVIPYKNNTYIFTYKASSIYFFDGLKYYNKILHTLKWEEK